MCGVFGVRSAERDVARLSYFGLFALQHRGQEAAGIAVSHRGRLTVLRDLGLRRPGLQRGEAACASRGRRDRAHALLDDRLLRLGERAAARPPRPRPHGRPRTQRQPDQHRAVLRAELAADPGSRSAPPPTPRRSRRSSRTTRHLCRSPWRRRWRGWRARTRSSRSPKKLLGCRDPHGIRPLALGRLGEDWVLASETCAFGLIALRARRPPRRGRRDRRGRSARDAGAPGGRQALCIFEHVYFARPDSTLAGAEVHGVRVRMGERLAAEAPVEADLVMPIPDSGTPAAVGYARASGIPRTAKG